MRCKKCDYRLWNLRSRNCPECGTPFRVSDYSFAINSVQFCCPHCGQDYYGTGERGHLRPFEFDCVRCHQRVSMDEMVLLPTVGVEESQTQTERLPWFDDSLGAFRRWTGTLLMALTRPSDMMRITPAESPAGAAWRFFLVNWLVVILGATGLYCAVPMLFIIGGRGPIFSAIGVMGLALLAGTATLLFCGFLWALLAHMILRATGPTSDNRGRTQQAILYSSGANIVSAVPCLGVTVGWIWWTVAAVLATREAQRVSTARATIAVVAPMAAAIALMVAAYIWLMSTTYSMGTTTVTFPTTMQASGVAGSFATALKRYSDTHGGAMPAHPIELLEVDPALSAIDFVVLGGTDPHAVTVADVPLDEFDGLDDRKRRLTIAKVTDGGAGNTPPLLRFGDFLFTYGGVDLNKATPEIWLVVGLRPPLSAGTMPADSSSTWVDFAGHDGSVTTIFSPNFESLIDQQNRTRAEAGLPQIQKAEFLALTHSATAGATTAPATQTMP